MRNLTSLELDDIQGRYELWAIYGSPSALQPEDVWSLIEEIRELHDLRDHLIALHRRAQDQISALHQQRTALQ